MDTAALLSPAMLAADAVPSGWERYGVFGSLAGLFLGGVIYLSRRREADHERELAAATSRADNAEARADRLEAELRIAITSFAEKVTAIQQTSMQALDKANGAVAAAIAQIRPPRTPR